MKRCALKRKTPLKRSRKPLPRMSAKKAAWQPRYRAALAEARKEQIRQRGHGFCTFPECVKECYPEPHHPAGRIGANILNFRFMCRGHHRWIHDNTKAARRLGVLE